MSGHNNEVIKKNIESSDVLVKKLGDLEKTIMADLKSGFQEVMGMAIPGAAEADLLKIDGVMKYSTELKIDEFLNGALTLAMAAFSGDEAEIATKAVAVAGVALKNIFGESGVSIGFKGSRLRGSSTRAKSTWPPFIRPRSTAARSSGSPRPISSSPSTATLSFSSSRRRQRGESWARKASSTHSWNSKAGSQAHKTACRFADGRVGSFGTG